MRIVFSATLILFVAACRHPDGAALQDDASAANGAVPAGFLSAESTLHLDDIRLILERDPALRTVEDFLTKLPGSYFDSPILVYGSKSLQKSNAMSPRVILHRSQKALLMAFGADDLPGSDRVELIQFNPSRRDFTFAEITFKPTSAPALVENPASCAMCHGSPLRPNWEPYARWPGVYSPNDDAEPQGFEKEAFPKFQAKALTHARYRHLDLSNYYKQKVRNFSANLDELNAVTFVANTQGSKNFGTYQYALQAVAKDCQDIPSFVPAALSAGFARSYTEVREDSREKIRLGFENRSWLGNQTIASLGFSPIKYPATGVKMFPEEPENENLPQNFMLAFELGKVTGFRWILERDGGSISDWFYCIGKDCYATPKSDEGFDELGFVASDDCNDLKAKSLGALAGASATGVDLLSTGLAKPKGFTFDERFKSFVAAPEGAAYQFVAAKCISCHVDNAGAGAAPSIPFDNLARMSSYLANASQSRELLRRARLEPTDQDAMPPGSPIRDQQILSLFELAVSDLGQQRY